jgi:molybdopterin biosynthesis enzyme MoaB
VITVADAITLESDVGGHEILVGLERSGHRVVERTLVPSAPGRLALVLRHWIASEVDAIFVCGCAGGLLDDPSAEVVRRFLEKELPGFAELLRALACKEDGPLAMLLDPVAGVCRGKLLFVLPMSGSSVKIGLEKLVLPVLRTAMAGLSPPASAAATPRAP